MRLFRTFCYNVYGGHLWTVYKTQMFNKLKVAFNDVYRNLFHIRRGESMSAIYVNNNVDSFRTLLRKAANNFRMRLMNSTNKYVCVVAQSVFFYTKSSFTMLWNKELFLHSWLCKSVILMFLYVFISFMCNCHT